MRILASTQIWVSEFVSQNVYGEQVGGYTNLQQLTANVQHLSNQLEYETYGEITNSIIDIRLDDLPSNIDKGFYVYLTKPTAQGTFTIDNVTYTDYGVGEYVIESIKPTYVNANVVKNRTHMTAKKVGT